MDNLTKEDFQEIESKLGYLINNWYIELVNTIINLAKKENVKKLYWNSSETLGNYGANESKTKFFYESLPSQMGFVKTKANLRGKGEENLWAMDLGRNSYAAEGLISLEQIPKAYQGAVIGILKSRGPYKKEELKRVLEIIKNSKERKKDFNKTDSFSYNASQTWDGGQQFTGKEETIVKQKLSSRLISHILETGSSPVKTFLSNLIDPNQHFDADVVGWALISKVNQDEWVINQIQTDTVNKYLKAKSKVLNEMKIEDKVLDRQSIIDRVYARTNSSIWTSKVENDPEFLRVLQNDPSIIQQLPGDQDLSERGISHDEWWSNSRTANSKKKKIKNSFNLRDTLRKKAQAKTPEEVWVDSTGKIAWSKGVKQTPTTLSYLQLKEIFRAGGLDPKSKLVSTLKNGEKFRAPYRKLSQEETESRIDEILGKLP